MANLFPAGHSSPAESVKEPQRKTTFQSRLRIAAQETEPTRERGEINVPSPIIGYACQ